MTKNKPLARRRSLAGSLQLGNNGVTLIAVEETIYYKARSRSAGGKPRQACSEAG